jgi:hypothetical protein
MLRLKPQRCQNATHPCLVLPDCCSPAPSTARPLRAQRCSRLPPRRVPAPHRRPTDTLRAQPTPHRASEPNAQPPRTGDRSPTVARPFLMASAQRVDMFWKHR